MNISATSLLFNDDTFLCKPLQKRLNCIDEIALSVTLDNLFKKEICTCCSMFGYLYVKAAGDQPDQVLPHMEDQQVRIMTKRQ